MISIFKKLAISSVIGLIIIVKPAYSEQCQFDFRHFFITNNGNLGLYLNQSGHWWYPCNFDTNINNVKVQSCKAAYAAVLTAKVTNKPMTFSWPGTCDELTNPTQSIADRGFVWMGVYDL